MNEQDLITYLALKARQFAGQRTICESIGDLSFVEVGIGAAKKDFIAARSENDKLDKRAFMKAFDYPSSGSKAYELKDESDAAVAFAVVDENQGPGAYVHELVGLVHGAGKEMLKRICEKYKKVWLQCNLIGNGEEVPYSPNEGLRDKFYRTCEFLKEYIVHGNKAWKCDASFFYTPSIPERVMAGYLEKYYGKYAVNEGREEWNEDDVNPAHIKEFLEENIQTVNAGIDFLETKAKLGFKNGLKR